MRTLVTTLTLALFIPAAAPAHFLFILPPAANGEVIPLVWSDGPAADPKISTEALIGGVGKSFAGSWSELPLNAAKGDGVWKTATPSAETKTITTKAEYGLVNRGEGHVFLVRYLAKWSKVVEASTEEPTLTVELTAVRGNGGFCFLATQGSKPLEAIDVTVYEPGSGKTRTLKTDAQGKTPTFSTPGQYAARVFWNDATAGEYEGRKYRGTYYYSTLTTDYRP